MTDKPTKTLSFLPIIIFCLTLTVYLFSPNITSTDSCFSTYLARSIVSQGNTNLDEMKEGIKQVEKLTKKKFDNLAINNGHYYSIYPIGTPLLATPLILVLDKYFDHFSQIKPTLINLMEEQIIASLFTALAAVFVYKIVYRLLASNKKSLFVTLIFAFGTSAWSTASRALWQHGPSILMLSIALYLLILASQKSRLIQYASIPLAMSYVIRPTNSLAIMIFSIMVLIYYKNYWLKYCLWSLTIALPFLLYNLSIYQSILSPYYWFSYEARQITLWGYVQALLGTLFSPGRGLFIFTPILLFSGYGLFLKIKQKQFYHLDLALLIIIVLHWLIISTLQKWWGGFSYGPRLFTDLLPYFIYFLIPVVQTLNLKTIKQALITTLFVLFIAASFFIHGRGAVAANVWQWNFTPRNVDLNPERLWDWKDLQFLR